MNDPSSYHIHSWSSQSSRWRDHRSLRCNLAIRTICRGLHSLLHELRNLLSLIELQCLNREWISDLCRSKLWIVSQDVCRSFTSHGYAALRAIAWANSRNIKRDVHERDYQYLNLCEESTMAQKDQCFRFYVPLYKSACKKSRSTLILYKFLESN